MSLSRLPSFPMIRTRIVAAHPFLKSIHCSLTVTTSRSRFLPSQHGNTGVAAWALGLPVTRLRSRLPPGRAGIDPRHASKHESSSQTPLTVGSRTKGHGCGPARELDHLTRDPPSHSSDTGGSAAPLPSPPRVQDSRVGTSSNGRRWFSELRESSRIAGSARRVAANRALAPRQSLSLTTRRVTFRPRSRRAITS